MIFHYLARGVVFSDGKVLLAHQKGADNTFLPGGHIELGERAESALAREIAEETGRKAMVRRFVGAVECLWIENDQPNHEIDLVFEVVVPGLDSNAPPQSRESHLEFIWVEPSALRTHNLLPYPMIECLMDWESDYRAYWGSSFND
jgi:8-oxo-dGTP pyrophosphatase MutT (NUDIX family)